MLEGIDLGPEDELGNEESHQQVLRVCFLGKVNAGVFWVG